jgi:hypothetical protein
MKPAAVGLLLLGSGVVPPDGQSQGLPAGLRPFEAADGLDPEPSPRAARLRALVAAADAGAADFADLVKKADREDPLARWEAAEAAELGRAFARWADGKAARRPAAEGLGDAIRPALEAAVADKESGSEVGFWLGKFTWAKDRKGALKAFAQGLERSPDPTAYLTRAAGVYGPGVKERLEVLNLTIPGAAKQRKAIYAQLLLERSVTLYQDPDLRRAEVNRAAAQCQGLLDAKATADLEQTPATAGAALGQGILFCNAAVADPNAPANRKKDYRDEGIKLENRLGDLLFKKETYRWTQAGYWARFVANEWEQRGEKERAQKLRAFADGNGKSNP